MNRHEIPKGWSITGRLIALALVPATMMLIAVNVSLYVTARQAVNAEIAERGRLLAAALAEASGYGVISGNAQSLDQTVSGLMAVDASVASIHVRDANGIKLTSAERADGTGELQTFEAPINARLLDVNLFDSLPAGGPAAGAGGQRTPAAAPVGHVQVVMSPAPLLDAMRERLYVGSAVVLLAAMFSAVVGLSLARRLREPLNAVMVALRGIRQGRYDLQFEERAGGELGELQGTIVDMANALHLTHQDLEEEVATRTEQLQQAVTLARAADAEKRRLIARGNELVEEERRRISLEIHDDLNALLVAIRLQVGTLIANAQQSDQSELLRSARRIAQLVDDVYARSRDIVQRLRPEIIDTLGLAGAIEEMVRHLNETDSSCSYAFLPAKELPVVPDGVAIAGYRVVQEALSNVVKHAKASKCVVTVAPTDSQTEVRVCVRDNGCGFDINANFTGLGLLGMRERVSALNGSLNIESAPGQGTSVTMHLPLGS